MHQHRSKLIPALLMAGMLAGAANAAAGEVTNNLLDSGAIPAPSKVPPAPATAPLTPGAAADDGDPTIRAANEAAARAVMENNLKARVIDSEAAVAKSQAELEKNKADVKKAIAEGRNPGSSQSNAPQNNGEGVPNGGADLAAREPENNHIQVPANNTNPIPGMSVTYVAGYSGHMEAGLQIARFGTIPVHEGTRIPTGENLFVKKISSSGVLVVDKNGKVYPVSFSPSGR